MSTKPYAKYAFEDIETGEIVARGTIPEIAQQIGLSEEQAYDVVRRAYANGRYRNWCVTRQDEATESIRRKVMAKQWNEFRKGFAKLAGVDLEELERKKNE